MVSSLNRSVNHPTDLQDHRRTPCMGHRCCCAPTSLMVSLLARSFLAADPRLESGTCFKFAAPSCQGPLPVHGQPLYQRVCSDPQFPNIMLSQLGRPTSTTLLSPANNTVVISQVGSGPVARYPAQQRGGTLILLRGLALHGCCSG